jgi:2-methylcitrate dehydratase PrpD
MTTTKTATTRELATFLAGLSYEDLPAEVIERAEELFIDWAASALAGKDARPVSILERFARTMGPADGPSEILVSRGRTSPLFAALMNAASSHVVEQDDVHNGSARPSPPPSKPGPPVETSWWPRWWVTRPA